MPRAAFLLPLVLAACSGNEQAKYDEVKVRPQEAEADEAIANAAARSGTATVAARGVPVSTPTADVNRGNALPAPFHGYWGVTPGDCELANVDAAGRIAIEGATIRFREARARVTRLTEVSPSDYRAELSAKDDTGPRTRPATFTLQEGGTRLVLRTQADDGAARTLRYQRC